MPKSDPDVHEEPGTLGARLKRTIEGMTDRGPTIWLAENALNDEGEPFLSVSTTTHILRTERRTGWMQPANMRAIAAAVRWPHSEIYIRNAIELGLDAPPGRSAFADSLPPNIDRLSPAGQDALRTMAWVLCRAEGVAK